MTAITATVNGRAESFDVRPMETLMDALRHRLHLRGTKDACREGDCGACTVLLDGLPVDSCIYPAQAVEGRRVDTIEGLRDPLGLRIQRAMVAAGGIQCGYCTPGIVVLLNALLRQNPAPNEATIRAALVGNICRCTGYSQIIEAVQTVIAEGPA
jgi:carbon-monoxide dehydrogenase small subunit